MRTRRALPSLALAAAALLAPVLTAPMAVAGSHHPAPGAALKARLDAAGAPDIVGKEPARSAAWLASESLRDRRATAFFSGTSNVSAMTGRAVEKSCGHGVCATAEKFDFVPQSQVSQATSYWCGPAAMRETLLQRDLSVTQGTLASQLKTTSNGTDWYGTYVNTKPSTGRPMEDVLNNRLGPTGAIYRQVDVNFTPTQYQQTRFQVRLVADVATNWPLVGNAYEVPGGPHLVGHPNVEIHHWFNIRGYTAHGANTFYEDSVHGAGSIGWSGSVPAYAHLPSTTVATIVGGRGYIW